MSNLNGLPKQNNRRIMKIGNRFYDLGTSNISFVKLAKTLNLLKVRNCYFMLELFDTSLIHIDPHARNKEGVSTLTKDQRARVIAECARNPWYFLREVARVVTPGETYGVPYKANRGNIAQAWCILNNLDSWLCLTRQKGKTISALILQAWIYNFGTTDSTFLFLNKSGDDAKLNLARIGEIVDLLPEYMQFKYIMEEDGKITKARTSATIFKHPVTGNEIRVKAQAQSYEKAVSIGRGLSATIFHYDEPEFTPFIDVIIENSFSTFKTVHDLAVKNNSISARIFTCTPGDLDTAPGRAAEKVLSQTYRWTDKLYDETPERIMELHVKNQTNRILYIEYSYLQIGETKAWLAEMYDQIGNPLTVRREILLQRLRGSDLSPYDRDDLDYISSVQREPVEEIFIRDWYRLDIYEKLNSNRIYIMGVDCSTGTNKDANAITIIDPYTVRPVAEFTCPYIGETEYEQVIIEIVQTLIPKAIVIIERNNVGDGILDHLLYSPIANNLYFDKARDLVENQIKESTTTESMLKHKANLKTTYGVYTEGSSRESMFGILARHIKEKKNDFVTRNITKDIFNLVRTSTGKIAARAKEHDDSVMSYLIALYVLYYGNNLALFGFFKTDLDMNKSFNSGLDKPNPADYLPAEELKRMRENELISKIMTYEDTVREHIMESQQNSILHSHASTITVDNIYTNSPSDTSDDRYVQSQSSLDLDIFDTLNNIDNKNDIASSMFSYDDDDDFDPFSGLF